MVVEFWKEGAREDWEFAVEIWKSEKRLYNALFFAQLALEKLLKALHYQRKDDHPLLTHDLVLLAKKVNLEIDDGLREDLKKISSFNVSARYDEMKRSFRRNATREFVDKWMTKAEELRQRLLNLFEE